MDKAAVFAVLKQEILNVLPLVKTEDITPDNRLVDLGANSLDRSEIVVNCMSSLNVKLEPWALAELKNIGDLCDALHAAIK